MAGSSAVRIQSLQPDEEAGWFFAEGLENVLRDLGAESIYLDGVGPAGQESSLLIDFKILRVGIRYLETPEIGNDDELRERMGHVALFLRISEQPSGKLLWSGEVSRDSSDTIRLAQLKVLENANIPFTVGQGTKNGDGSNLLEPVLITGITGTIIFLFYSLRSR